MRRKVAPRAGAWLETNVSLALCGSGNVAPRAGAWLETVCTDSTNNQPLSRPVRARGLKPEDYEGTMLDGVVAPRAGAWLETPNSENIGKSCYVAPRAGAWLETGRAATSTITMTASRPVRARGLKLLLLLQELFLLLVAPRAGAWLETARG